MAEIKNKSNEARDYKERFEFRLTNAAGNIICQRYFKINNFNPTCLKSTELVETIRNCAYTIDRDLKQKTQIYLEIFAPQVFDSVEEMNSWLANPENVERIGHGNGLVVRNSENTDYFMGANGTVKECGFKFDDGELTNTPAGDLSTEYKFSFLIDDSEVCSVMWRGVYPKYISNSIDLSNKRGKYNEEDVAFLSFEQYLLYRLVKGRSDLVYGLIKDICYTCSSSDNSYYTTTMTYGDTKYKNIARHFQFNNQNSYNKN